MAQMQEARNSAAPERVKTIGKLTNLMGAAMSLALIVGIGVWGYKLLVRDVSGVPVVRAAEGPMRVQPDDPGGQLALNQGLAVNNVAAEGTAADTADRLVLAPEPLDLSLELVPAEELEREEAEATPLAEAGEPVSADDEAVQLAAVEALASQIAAGQDALQDLIPPTPEPAAMETPAPKAGLARSLRPMLRPASLSQKASTAIEAALAEASADVTPETVPSGTRLAQLGAFESEAVARSEWGRLSGQFGEYLEGKKRVIQKAQSGGRTFYRLRAMGFDDLNDARRFCSALLAESADCIPVTSR